MNARLIAAVGIAFVAIATPLTSRAVTLQVNCDQPQGKLPTIGAALKIVTALGSLGPNSIEVTGACQENISLSGVTNLTLTAKNGASITDASGGTAPVITLARSQGFALNGFAIRGGGGPFNTAIGCFGGSTCLLSGNNVQILRGTAIVTAGASALVLKNDVLEQSYNGLLVLDGSYATMTPATIRNNAAVGVNVGTNSFLATNFSTVVEGNGTHGIWVHDHSSARISQTTVTRNAGIGVFVQMGSEAMFFLVPGTQNTITYNGLGVAVQDLSWANMYSPGTTVSGSAGQPDIQCWGRFSGATNASAAGTTSCDP